MKETLKILRENRKYSQSGVASYLGISRQMYIKYENGEVEPPVRVIVELSKLYHVSYEGIIDNLYSKNNQNEDVLYKQTEEIVSVAEPAVGYETSSISFNEVNDFEHVKTVLQKLSFQEQLHLLTFLAALIGKNGEKDIANSFDRFKKIEPPHKPILNNMTKEEINEQIEKMSGILKGIEIDDPKQARLEHLYKKYGIE